MSEDTIYRQDAVSEIHKYFWKEIEKTSHGTDEDGEDVYTDMPTVNLLLAHNKQLSKRIKVLPSAQPTHSNTPNTLKTLDCVGREKVIDIIHTYWKKRLDTLPTRMTEDGEVYADIKSMDMILEHNKILSSMIKQLPSAQPEHICVNCGRTVNNGGWYEDGRTRCPIEEHYALPKDGYCHLWEKIKVWEDGYVKRPEEGEK